MSESDYTMWTNPKTWTIQTAKGDTGLGEGDVLEFTLDSSDTSKIQISKVTCNHLAQLQQPQHKGSLWMGVCQGAGGRAEGTMQGTAGKPFEIVSDANGKTLTCNLIKAGSTLTVATSESDGACWTAKGG